jgi:hypothetical protein
MNVTNITGLDLCPSDNRRSIGELWSKTFAVHFTTIAAFCHLLSIRGQAPFSWKVVFYILAPWHIFVQHALALAIIIVAPLVNTFLPPAKRASTWRALRWLFGSLNKPLEAQVPERKSWRDSYSCANFGRAIVAAAFLTQCSGSIYLFTRRQSFDPDAITRADRKVFELACSGLLVGALWIAQMWAIQPFAGAVPPMIEEGDEQGTNANPGDIELVQDGDQQGSNSNSGDIEVAENGHNQQPNQQTQHNDESRPKSLMTRLDELMWHVRDINVMSKSSKSPFGAFTSSSWSRHCLMLGVLALVTRQVDVTQSILSLFLLEIIAVCTALFFFVALLSATIDWSDQFEPPGRRGGYRRVPQSERQLPIHLQTNQPPKTWLWHIGGWLHMGVTMAAPSGIMMLVCIIGMVASIMCIWAFVDMFLQIQRLAVWPTDEACSLLWSDPASNWIWALA